MKISVKKSTKKTTELNIITPQLLRTWKPCEDGYKRFCELFPKGADLLTAIDGLVKDNHDSWGQWLFGKCRELKLFPEVIVNGYRNSGDRNSGDRNSGDWNSGYRNSGDRNSGDWNSGDRNSGDRNSGDRNSGDWNSGDWNSGDRNSGYMNSETPSEILVFNKPCSREDWEKAAKPNFIYFELTYWVDENEMTDAEKVADPNFYIRGGQLRKREYKEAWALSFSKASHQDIEKLKALPNFDSAVFEKISGLKI